MAAAANNTTVLVTGASGFIGTLLVDRLLSRGYRVRALSRNEPPAPPPGLDTKWPDPLRHPDCEFVRGDILDRDALARAVRGCMHVYHVAAYAKNWARDPKIFYQLNVLGMHNVFDAAAAAGVEKIIWTSTCVTSGPSFDGRLIDESTPRSTPRFFTEYERTKTIAEHEAIERAAAGLPVVIVKPTRVYGPGRMTEGNSASRLIGDYSRGRMPFLLNFGRNVGNWAYVADVAEGHILAMERGRCGESYLLGGENATLRELFQMIDQVSGRRHLKIPLLFLIPMFSAWLMAMRARVLGIYPPITPGWVRTFCHDWPYSCDKAVSQLGYRITPLREGIDRTLRWLAMMAQTKS